MPTASGPNTLGESNLVFAYDTGDVNNSYIGEPTVNVFPDPKILNGTSGWGISNATGGTTSVDTGRNGGQSIKVTVASGGDQYQHKGYAYGVNKGGSTFTYSAYIRTSGIVGTGVGMSTYWYDINGNWIFSNNTASTTITGNQNWTRVTATSTAPTGTYYTIAIFYPVDKNGLGTYWITDVQIEEKSHVTPFVIGTRSVTQGLLDLTGNRTIDLTNASFNSNAQMIFDGTNDYIESPATTLSGDFTISQIVNLASSAAGPMPIGGGLSSNGTTYQGYVWFRNSVNQVILAVDGELQVIFSVDPTLWINKTIMYTVRRSGSTATFYINGAVIATNTVSTNNFTIRTIGYSWSSAYHSNGTINNTFIYNSALTPLEIKQNYQQYLTRFNLS